MKKNGYIDETREISLKSFCDRMAEMAADLNDDEVFDLIIHQTVLFYKEQSQQEFQSCKDQKLLR